VLHILSVAVAFVIQRAKRMHLIILSSVAYLAVSLINGIIFGKKFDWTYRVFFLFSQHLLSETSLILRRIRRDIIVNVRTSSYNVPVILVRF